MELRIPEQDYVEYIVYSSPFDILVLFFKSREYHKITLTFVLYDDVMFLYLQAFISSGTNLQLSFLSNAWSDRPEDRTPTREFVDFDREVGKVSHHISVQLYSKHFVCLTNLVMDI